MLGDIIIIIIIIIIIMLWIVVHSQLSQNHTISYYLNESVNVLVVNNTKCIYVCIIIFVVIYRLKESNVFNHGLIIKCVICCCHQILFKYNNNNNVIMNEFITYLMLLLLLLSKMYDYY